MRIDHLLSATRRCPRSICISLTLLLCGLCTGALSAEVEAEVAVAPEPPANATDLLSAPVPTDTQTSPPAAAQDSDVPMAPETTVVGRPGAFPAEPLSGNVAVTPSLTETPVGEVGSALTVITGEQIRESQKTSVSDVLREVPGVDVVQSGPTGGITSVFIRGTASAGTKVLIDGIPANDPSNASRAYDFSTLTTENIERIEVLRGPQSTLYGSDAVGGVINIITKRGAGPTTVRTDLIGGSYGTAREALNVSGGNKLTNYSIGAAYLQSDGFSAADKRFGNTERDGVRNATFSGRFGITPSEDFDIDYVFRYIDVDARVDDYDYTLGRPVDNLYRENRTQAFLNRVSSRLATLDGFWEHRVGFSYVDYDRRDTDPGPYDVPHFLGRTNKFDYRSHFNLAEWDTLIVGTDYQDEQSPTNADPYTTQTDTAVFFENQFRMFERWFTTVGARWDDYSLAGAARTYRVTTRYNLKETGTSFHGSMGTAFRAPSLAEYAYGTNLKPERSKGWDCGIEQSFADGRFTVDTTYFRNDYTDLLQFSYTSWQMENIGRAMSDGVELTGTWNLNCCTSLIGSYTYTYTEDVETGLELLRRAPHKVRVAVKRKYLGGRGNVLLETIYVSPREDTSYASATGRVTLDEYWLVNAATTIDVTEHWQLLARLDNLLDYSYEEVYGYGTAGLSFYGGLSGHW
jgi:vitamin B12 transporter